jgi:hypothetical protein
MDFSYFSLQYFMEPLFHMTCPFVFFRGGMAIERTLGSPFYEERVIGTTIFPAI